MILTERDTLLSKIFWESRGTFPCSIDRGVLHKVKEMYDAYAAKHKPESPWAFLFRSTAASGAGEAASGAAAATSGTAAAASEIRTATSGFAAVTSGAAAAASEIRTATSGFAAAASGAAAAASGHARAYTADGLMMGFAF